MLGKCIDVQYIPGKRYSANVPKDCVGYTVELFSSDLLLIVDFEDGRRSTYSIKEFFKKELKKRGRKNFNWKVVKGIWKSKPSKMNFDCLGPSYEDLVAWAARLEIK